jgi:hypothetical protein
MGGETATQDWELIVGRDLASSLIPRGELRRLQRATDLRMVPDDAYHALVCCIGRLELEDILLVPAFIRPVGRRRRCLYGPMCVAGIGARGLGLWVQAPPSPHVRVVLPFEEVAAVERHAAGSWRDLTVISRDATFWVRYDADGDASANVWISRLEAALLAVTGREVIAASSGRARTWPWQPRSRALYVPRAD